MLANKLSCELYQLNLHSQAKYPFKTVQLSNQ